MNNEQEPVLCYVESGIAYFTTQELSKQWGDDWNDTPYEHNAGEPYTYSKHDEQHGRNPWEIVEVRFTGGDFVEPCGGHLNSPYSVERINGGAVPWLSPSQYACHKIYIPAGTPLTRFCDLIERAGGMTSHRHQALKAQLRKAVEIIYRYRDAIAGPGLACNAVAFLDNHADIVKEING